MRVTATTTFGARKTIYFKSFDLDDPSTDAAPVDSNGSAGDDNRGGVGTPAHFGLLSAVGGNGTTNFASATTDANGLASDLLTTLQPGDNFMVAASQDSTYLNGLTVNGITLRDSSGNTVGSGTKGEIFTNVNGLEKAASGNRFNGGSTDYRNAEEFCDGQDHHD